MSECENSIDDDITPSVTPIKSKLLSEPAPINRRICKRDLSDESVSASTENMFQNLHCYLRRQNEFFFRRLSFQTSSATTDFDIFKNWFYQDLEKHRDQLREASSSLFFRKGNKSDNTLNVDVVITFRRSCHENVINEFRNFLQLSHPTLCVECRKHYFSNYTENALYITAVDSFFQQLAQDCFAQQNFDDSQEHPYIDSRFYPCTPKLSTLQRQSILIEMLSSWTFQVDDQSEEVIQIPLIRKYLNPGESIIDSLISVKKIDQIFPLHHEEDLNMLKMSWVTNFFNTQPLDLICSYFGMKISIYFAFLGFYTKFLLYPALFGLIITYFVDLVNWFNNYVCDIIQFSDWISLPEANLTNDILLFIFTIFNIFWSTFMLQKWDLTSRKYINEWSHTILPQMDHKMDSTKKDDKNQEVYNFRRILFKYCITFPIIGISLAVTFKVMFNIFNLQTWWDCELIDKQNYPVWTRFIPKILLAIIINSSNYFYYVLAVWLNQKENYTNAESKENNLILKLVLFQFLNSFLPLLYIAFYLSDIEKLQEQLATQLITRQVIGNFHEAVWPFLKESYRLTTRKLQHRDQMKQNSKPDDNEAKCQSVLSKGELESCMYRYESTFDDYLELVVQFGYVMLFAPVFPLAALCAFLNNLIEIRSDAFKLSIVYQRPFGHEQVKNIGEWANVLHYLSIVAITTNCALMVVTGQISRVFAFHQPTHILLTSVVIEHILLLMKWLIPTFYLL